MRRVVGADGRSRCFVNGQALPAQAVRELGAMLIEVPRERTRLLLEPAESIVKSMLTILEASRR